MIREQDNSACKNFINLIITLVTMVGLSFGSYTFCTWYGCNSWTSFMGMRNNYTGFSTSENEAIKETAAHEYFHAIQTGYDVFEQAWLKEATAAWVEDEVYGTSNGNYQYLPDWFKEPHIALNYNHTSEDGSSISGNNSLENDLHWYGSWIFFTTRPSNVMTLIIEPEYMSSIVI